MGISTLDDGDVNLAVENLKDVTDLIDILIEEFEIEILV